MQEYQELLIMRNVQYIRLSRLTNIGAEQPIKDTAQRKMYAKLVWHSFVMQSMRRIVCNALLVDMAFGKG